MTEIYNYLQGSLISPLIRVLVILILAWLGLRLVKSLRKKFIARIDGLSRDAAGKARLYTMATVVDYTLRMFILGVSVIIILGTLGIDIGPLLTSAGIAGLAISLGAQSLIKDYIGGMVILIEDLYHVGELVQIGAVTGRVEVMTMRQTQVRDGLGKLHSIPNGEVRVLANLSRDWSNAVVDLNLSFDADLRKTIAVLNDALRQVASDERIRDIIIEEPQILGWNSLNDWAIQVRLSLKIQAGNADVAGRVLREYAVSALQQAAIPLAVPSREVTFISPVSQPGEPS
jgi:moderate conductance mechanosensitive channel